MKVCFTIPFYFQPCYQGSSSGTPLLDEGASTVEIVRAVNIVYDEFRDKCIKDNHALANQLEINDGETNVKSASRVCVSFKLSLFLASIIKAFSRWW